jgi:hypothetical protein
MSVRTILLLAFVVAQDKPKKVPAQAHPKVDQLRVDQAIDDGVKFLRTQLKQMEQEFVHAWEQGAPAQNYLELVLWTWVHAGVPEDDAEFQAMLSKMLAGKLTTTYKVSLQALILQKLNAEKYQWRIAQCAQFLVDNQCQNGQWCYGHETDVTEFQPPKEEPKVETEGTGKPADSKKKTGSTKVTLKKVPMRKKKPGCPTGDNSNSQYAALGIRACLEANVDIPREILVNAKNWWERQQQADGGWMYDGMGGPAIPPGQQAGVTYGSMTLGAIGALTIYKHYLKENYKGDAMIQKGFDWFAKNFSVTENPKYAEWHYYTLYALERAGDLFGTEFVGKHEWYPEGANWLLDHQKAGGGWSGKGTENDIAATCFAILFLRRATRPIKIATGPTK